MQPESCDDEGDYQRANERRETECAFIWYAWMCACVNERATERKNQRRRGRKRERLNDNRSKVEGRKITDGKKRKNTMRSLGKKEERKDGRKRQMRRKRYADMWFELEVWSGLNNFLKNCKTFFGSRAKREENRIGRNVNRERRVSRPGMRTPVEARRGYVRASI